MNAIQVTLTDGSVHAVHEPQAKDSAWVIQALLPMLKLRRDRKTFDVVDLMETVMTDEDAVLKLVHVVATCSDMTDKAVGELGIADFYGLLGSAFTLVDGGGSPLAKKTPSRSRATKRA